MKLFRDPIYEYITCNDEELKLIDSPWFQRLRHCSQNGPARLVYPSLLGTRFEHSLGVMELASRTLDSLFRKEKYDDPAIIDRFLERCVRDLNAFLGINHTEKPNRLELANKDIRRIFRLTALCHDIGHFPLSHTLEQSFEAVFWQNVCPTHSPVRAPHENISAEIVRVLAFELNEEQLITPQMARAIILTMLTPEDVKANDGSIEISVKQSVFYTLGGILNGSLDIDNLDYMQRDGHLSGTTFGLVDVQRFIDSMMLVEPNESMENNSGHAFSILPSGKAVSTIESALIERYKEYKWVCFHHKALFFGKMACELGKKLLEKEKERLFEPFNVENITDYPDTLWHALGTPESQIIPPLHVYKFDEGYFKLCADFFIHNPDAHFFDDIWYSLKCRQESQVVNNYVQTLVERRDCGITVWKDLSQYKKFESSCLQAAKSNNSFVELLQNILMEKGYETPLEDYIKPFINEFWQLFPTWDFNARQEIERNLTDETEKSLAEQSDLSLKVLVSPMDWGKVFRKIEHFRIYGRSGQAVRLDGHSDLLRRLKDFRGEIPFFVFVVGPPEDIHSLKLDPKSLESLLTSLAKGFINGCLVALEKPIEEVKVAFLQAIAKKVQ